MAEGSPEASSSAAPQSRMVAEDMPPADPGAAAPPDVLHDPVYLAIAIVLALAFLALVGYAVWYWRKRKAAEAGEMAAAA
jgi:hypothetical protein